MDFKQNKENLRIKRAMKILLKNIKICLIYEFKKKI